jgi:hypothetical protein
MSHEIIDDEIHCDKTYQIHIFRTTHLQSIFIVLI